MKTDTHTATFLVLERDPVVRMDIQELLLRSFPGGTVIVVAGWEDLQEALDVTRGRRSVILSSDAEILASQLAAVDLSDPIGAVLIAEGPLAALPSSTPYAFVQRPFRSDDLLVAVKSALGHLRSSL